MVYACAFRSDPPLALVRFNEGLTGPELLRATESAFGDVRWPYGANAVWDFLAVRQIVLVQEDLEAIAHAAQAAQPRVGPGRSILVTRDETAYMMARLYQHRWAASQRTIEVAPTLDEACARLGLRVEDLPPL